MSTRILCKFGRRIDLSKCRNRDSIAAKLQYQWVSVHVVPDRGRRQVEKVLTLFTRDEFDAVMVFQILSVQSRSALSLKMATVPCCLDATKVGSVRKSDEKNAWIFDGSNSSSDEFGR